MIKKLTILAVLIPMATVFSYVALAGTLNPGFTDFEEAGFVDGGSVHALNPVGDDVNPPVSGTNPDAQGWSIRASDDEEIVDIGGTDAAHGKVWRLSDLGTTGNLQTRPHSPHGGLLSGGAGPKQTSGEAGAIDDFGGEAVTTANYYAQIDFRSATGAPQTDLVINVSASCGDDCRHGFVRIIDDGTGLDLGFFETGDNTASGSCSSFPFTLIDLNLSYSDWHTLGIEIFFIDGFGPGGVGAEGNDVVNVYVDGTLVHTGTSWETCYAYVGSGAPRSVDRLVFYQASSGKSTSGGGLYIDNVLVTDLCPAGNCLPPFEPKSVGECVSTLFHDACSGLTGQDRASCVHDQQNFCFDLFGQGRP